MYRIVTGGHAMRCAAFANANVDLLAGGDSSHRG
jgi:hypothetical protein